MADPNRRRTAKRGTRSIVHILYAA